MLLKLLLPRIIFAFGVIILLEVDCARVERQGRSLISEEGSQKIAKEFLRVSPTFRFDGMEDTLKLVKSRAREKPYCWEFSYEFRCRHAGYGDRSGKILAQVITFHKAVIVVQKGEVIHAILDGKWDMLDQKLYKGG